MSETDSFDDAWLALRESADDRARDVAGVDDALKTALDAGGERTETRILDLGSGTGANLRRLAPRLGHAQHWTLVDHDAALLGRLEARLAPWAERHRATLAEDGDALVIRADGFDVRVSRVRADLATSLDTLPYAAADLLTGSALLDLAGADWLDALARLAADNSCAVLFALSYDGRMIWSPRLDDDRAVHERFTRHQRTDKGLGPSLGADAAARLAERLGAHGLAVSVPRSDWTLGADDADLQRELAIGLARAATDIDPTFAGRAERWRDARLAHIDERVSALVVGHVEVFVPPPHVHPTERPAAGD